MFTDRKVFFTLFKVFCVFASVFILFSVLTSCCFASSDSLTVGIFSDNYHRVDVWVDPDTGVNYLVVKDFGRGGVCPRYNADGSLMVSEMG